MVALLLKSRGRYYSSLPVLSTRQKILLCYSINMTKKPLVNALGALGYILLIVVVMNTITGYTSDQPDTYFAPVIFLSLFTLSAAVMACMFFYQPLQLLIDGKKKEAVALAVKTIGFFAALTAAGLVLLLVGLI